MTTPRTTRRRGFTLIEILVVIGIIVLLAGILLPLVNRSRRQAQKLRTSADMQSIITAIQAFKTETGDIPRTPLDTPNLGAATLGRYLVGPLGDGYKPGTSTGAPDDTDDPAAWDAAKEYQAGAVVQAGGNRFVALIPNSNVATSTTTTWQQVTDPNHVHDYVDGTGMAPAAGRKKIGPFMGEKMAMGGIAFVDHQGNAILYFPARPGKTTNVTTANSYVVRSSTLSPPNKTTMRFDADDNLEVFRRAGEADPAPLRRIQAALGDFDGSGKIETNLGEIEVATADLEYILWAAGADGKFGPDVDAAQPANAYDRGDWDKADDLTNFRQ